MLMRDRIAANAQNPNSDTTTHQLVVSLVQLDRRCDASAIDWARKIDLGSVFNSVSPFGKLEVHHKCGNPQLPIGIFRNSKGFNKTVRTSRFCQHFECPPPRHTQPTQARAHAGVTYATPGNQISMFCYTLSRTSTLRTNPK